MKGEEDETAPGRVQGVSAKPDAAKYRRRPTARCPFNTYRSSLSMPLTFSEYQRRTRRTAVYPIVGKRFVYPAIGLAGETGEVLEKIKKVLRDKNGVIDEETKKKIGKELGDVLWYVAQLCTELGLNLEKVAEENLMKVEDRARRGAIHGEGDER